MENTFNKEKGVVTLGCPRCGQKHQSLPILEFKKPIVVNAVPFQAWTMCPVLSEPIILSSEVFSDGVPLKNLS